jgi:hypothetical protein
MSMLYKGLLYVSFFPSLYVSEPPASVWSLPDQLRIAQFVAHIFHISLEFGEFLRFRSDGVAKKV